MEMKYIIKLLDLRNENKKKCYLQISAYNDGRYINTCTEIVTKSKATRLSLDLAKKVLAQLENSKSSSNKTPFIIEVTN